MRGILYDAVMALSEDEIRKVFPKGAIQKANRFKPAQRKTEATKTLARLLADKRKRMQPERYPVRSGPQRLRWSAKERKWVVKGFEGDEEHGYTHNRSRSLDGVPSVPPDVQERFDKEAEERFHGSHEEVGRTDASVYIARRAKKRAA